VRLALSAADYDLTPEKTQIVEEQLRINANEREFTLSCLAHSQARPASLSA
jgi:hypothetical protein